MKRRTLLHFALPVSLAGSLLGCGGSGLGEPAGIQNRLTLENFGSCDALEQYIEDQAVLDMKLQLDSIKSGGWYGPFFGRAEATSAPPAADSGAGAKGPSAYTQTNTQVAGVDEADFVKNDGTRILQLVGQKLYATRSWPANTLAISGSVSIEGYPTQMFLDEKNRVVVFSGVYTKYDGFTDGGGVLAGRGVADIAACAGPGCGYYYSNTTKVTVVDVSNIASLKVVGEYYLPGGYADSRRIGSAVRIVLRDSFRWPSTLKWWPESANGELFTKGNEGKLDAAIEVLKADNERLIRGQSLAQWLPAQTRKLADGKTVEIPLSCGDFYKSNGSVHLGVATVATLDLDSTSGSPITRTSIMGEVGQIYANKTSLYIASDHWWWFPKPGQTDYTYLHKFDLTDKSRARYVASGGVEGHIVDQFSMDENASGFFRIATTINTRVPDADPKTNPWGRLETTNRITVLKESAGALVVSGKSEEVAKGERIYSSRFVGDRGFVVTFRQVDPLFTFDLSNPAAPKRVGELKVPGFSTYIHPIDANNLLTIGVYMPDPGTGGMVDPRERRLQLSIFDVSDFANPKQKFTQLVGSAYGWSDASYDHKAFNYFAERKLLAIPFSDYTVSTTGDPWGSFSSELRVYNVDATAGFSLRGTVSMKDVYVSAGSPDFRYYYTPAVRRSVMATDAGQDYVYAVSDAGVRVVTGPTLGTTLGTVIYPRTDIK